MEKIQSKTLGNTFLYNKFADYDKALFTFIMTGTMVDKAKESFNDIKYEIKRHQVSNALVKVLSSDNIVLIIGQKALPKAFKVFAAKDIKGDKKLKIFIDCTGIIAEEDGKYVCLHPTVLVSHLVNAMNALIYYADNKRILMNSNLTIQGTKCFSSLFVYVLDYIFKINSMSNIRDKALFLSAVYYQTNILGRESDEDSVLANAKRVSALSEREQEVILMQCDENSFSNIKNFIETCSKILRLDKLTLDLFVEKWMYLYGQSTIFGLELYPQFAAMMTDTYVGAYLNNQKTIERVASKNMVDFSKTVLNIGSDAV